MRISACVICKNEEANIRHWLAAVKPLADELVVVDTGSTDRTVELAREGDALVYDFPWINDFSAAKNYALDQATGDWIIFLDTDESFRLEDVPDIRPFLKKIHHNRKVAGLLSPLVNIDVDNHNRVLTTGYQMRIFRREKTLRYCGRIHEMVKNLAPKGHDREFRMTGFTVIHTGYSAHIMAQKSQRDLELLLAEEKRMGGVAVDHYTYLVDCYMDLKEYDKALHFAKLAVDHDKESTLAGQSKKVHWQLLGAMTAAGATTAELDEALDRFLAEHPDWAELYWRRALLRYDERDYAQAGELLAKTLALCQQGDDHPEALMGSVMEGAMPQVHHYYATVLARQGKWQAAEKEWECSLQRYPFYEAAFYHWYLLLLRQERSAADRLCSLGKFYDFQRDRLFLLAQLQQFALDEVYRRIGGPVPEGAYGQLATGNHQAAVELAGRELQQVQAAIRQAVRLGQPAELVQWQLILPLPLVSVMIPTFNRPGYFEQTLKSVLAQTYQNLDIIICDNSTDEATANLMQKYLDDPRIRYIRNREARSKAENFAPFESLARGEYLQWLMDDDLLAPEKIAKMIRTFQQHPQISLVTSRRGIIDETGQMIGQAADTLEIEGDYMIAEGQVAGRIMLSQASNYLGEPSAVLFRRQDLQHHYWHAESRGYQTISDVAMWLELLEQGDCAIFKNPLSFYRSHAGQEGQQIDVILLSRIEWLQLGQEYYARQLFLTKAEDYLSLLGRILDEESQMAQMLRPQASPEMWQRYENVLAQARICQQELLKKQGKKA